jgi:DNA-binding beta-propeller fold protein YncE
MQRSAFPIYILCRATGVLCALLGASGCRAETGDEVGAADTTAAPVEARTARLPLMQVADVNLPGRASRFDYQDLDPGKGHLVVAHMNDGSVLVNDLRDGSVLKELKGIPTARGVAVADDVGLIFVSSSPNQLVLIDNTSLSEKKRVTTGNAPDGVGWDPTHKIVGVSDQRDGAISLIADAGSGRRTQIPLGTETGNVIYDNARGVFWITVVAASPPDKLVAIDPTTATITTSLGLPGCKGAHGLRLHPDGQSAFIACELNDTIARVDLGGAHGVATQKTGAGPDVLSIDPGLGWLYVAAESGDLTIFDITRPGVAPIRRNITTFRGRARVIRHMQIQSLTTIAQAYI